MRKLSTVFIAGTLGAAFLALAACSSPATDDTGVRWFSDATFRVDLERARRPAPAFNERR